MWTSKGEEMKNKFFKVFSLILLAFIGAITFSGCSVELTEDQTDKIMYVVDNADKFMDQVLGVLEKQNQKLDKEQAYKLYQLAINRIIINHENVRDNLIIDMNMDMNHDTTVISYVVNDKDVIISKVSDGLYSVFYEDEEADYDYSKNGNLKVKRQVNNIHLAWQWGSLDFIKMWDLTVDDVVICDILENGNYSIKFMKNLEEEIEGDIYFDRYIVEAEIAKDGCLLNSKITLSDIDSDGSYLQESVINVSFSYGQVDSEYVNAMLAEAKAYTQPVE